MLYSKQLILISTMTATMKKKNRKYQVLMRLQRNGKTSSLLVGLWNGATATENSAEVPQTVKTVTIIPLLGIYPEELKAS